MILCGKSHSSRRKLQCFCSRKPLISARPPFLIHNVFDFLLLSPVYTIQPVVKPVDTIQPVVNPVVKPPWQPVEYLYTRYNRLSERLSKQLLNRLYNRFDNRLYRVNKHPTAKILLLQHNQHYTSSHDNHVINWPASTILNRESDKSTRWIKEAVHIRKEGRQSLRGATRWATRTTDFLPRRITIVARTGRGIEQTSSDKRLW